MGDHKRKSTPMAQEHVQRAPGPLQSRQTARRSSLEGSLKAPPKSPPRLQGPRRFMGAFKERDSFPHRTDKCNRGEVTQECNMRPRVNRPRPASTARRSHLLLPEVPCHCMPLHVLYSMGSSNLLCTASPSMSHKKTKCWLRVLLECQRTVERQTPQVV